MFHGTVLFFDRLKGYGFIVPAERGADLFFHYQQIQVSGLKRLEKGQAVTYEIGDNPRKGGLMAINIRPINQANETCGSLGTTGASHDHY